MHDEDFCFRRLTITGRVTRLITKDCTGGTGLLYFLLTVERSNRPDKVLRVCGEIWGPQLAMAEQIQDGVVVKLVGCLKEPSSLTAAAPLLGFDLEQLLEVQP